MFKRLKISLLTRLKATLDRQNHLPSGGSWERVSIVGSTFSENVTVGSGTTVKNSVLSGTVTLGDRGMLDGATVFGQIRAGQGVRLHRCSLVGHVTLGKYTSLWGPDTDITGSGRFPVSVGNFCSIARNVSIQSFNHNHQKATTYFIGQNFFGEHWENERVSNGKGIVIGSDVWIGTQCVILGGVSIGHGALVAANSVVNKDVPPYAIVAGTPAKVIGYRFDEAVIQKLLELQWWDWDDERIQRNKSFFRNDLSPESINAVVA